MKKVLCVLLVLVMLFAFAGCEDKAASNEIIKEKKLSSSNAQTYLDIDVDIKSISTHSSAYDGEDTQYAGGQWRWATATVVVNVANKSSNKVDFEDCKFVLDVNYGTPFSTEKLNIELDAEGKYNKEISLTSDKIPFANDGYAVADFAKPTPTFTLDDVNGKMKIHIKLDENGSVVTNTEE